MRIFWSLGLVVCLAMSASADTFTVSVVLPKGNAAQPGVPLAIEVHGLLTNDLPGNDGLAFFTFDVLMSGPSAVNLSTAINWDAPSDGSMDRFRGALGYGGDYPGTAVGDTLIQAGGAQNTIGNDPNQAPFLNAPSASAIDFNIGHLNQVLLEGTITFPLDATDGDYTINAFDVMVNVLSNGQTQVPYGVYVVEEAIGSLGPDAVISLSVAGCSVAADCTDADVCTFDRCVGSVCLSDQTMYGDVAGPLGCGPDGSVGVFDVTAVLDAFSGAVGVCVMEQADIAGLLGACTPDAGVDIFDVTNVLDAFSNSFPCSCTLNP